MKEDTVLNRIIDVYNESLRVITSISEKEGNNRSANTNPLPNHSYLHPEIEGNYLLFFNNTYTTFVRKWLKKILKKIAWPALKRQVFFNATVKQILYGVVQENHVLAFKQSENNDRFNSIEQKIEQFSKFEVRIEQLAQIEQQLLEKISIVTDKIEPISQIEHEIEQILAKLEVDQSLTSKAFSADESKLAGGLWFNDPIIVSYRGNEACWAGTNERILEKNFILLSLARLYESSQIEILDVGSAESLLAYELASLNYTVTAIDIRPMTLSHPNLKFIKCDICQPVLSTASFDCVIALSTIEHIGLGWYGDEIGESLDHKAVQQIYSLIKPGGSFILTVPYGKGAVTPVHRIYDRDSLQKLIQNFSIVTAVYGIRLDDFTYNITENEAEASLKQHNPSNYLPGAVAMIVCKKM
jgi:2-polyprenyl-3-methyl-5-hydroxy-6-metoxy-1,4-benzoquinol methylase